MNPPTRPWADLVFHVLAHVPPHGPCAASVFDPIYVAFCNRALGPAEQRHLAQDAVALSQLLPTHDALVAAQMLAWLFDEPKHAVAVGDFELMQLPDGSAAERSLLAVLASQRDAAELLWAAALLEHDHHARLPASEISLNEIASALSAAAVVAPMLAVCTVAFVRALRLRGRVRRRDIWVGMPSAALDLSIAHVVWQASHEATVLEVSECAHAAGLALRHAQLEHAAAVVLASRASSHGQGSQHAAWLSHFGRHAPCLDPASLDPSAAAVVRSVLAS